MIHWSCVFWSIEHELNHVAQIPSQRFRGGKASSIDQRHTYLLRYLVVRMYTLYAPTPLWLSIKTFQRPPVIATMTINKVNNTYRVNWIAYYVEFIQNTRYMVTRVLSHTGRSHLSSSFEIIYTSLFANIAFQEVYWTLPVLYHLLAKWTISNSYSLQRCSQKESTLRLINQS